MVGWHHRLNGHEFEQALGVGAGQGRLACCSPWGHKELDTTERLNNNNTLTPTARTNAGKPWGFSPLAQKSQPTILLLGRPQVSPLTGTSAQDREQKETRQQAGADVFGRQGKRGVFLLYAFPEPRTSRGQEQLKNSLYFSYIVEHIRVTVQCVTIPLCPVKEPRSARPVGHSGPASSGVLPTKRNPDVYRLTLSPKTSTIVPDGGPQT